MTVLHEVREAFEHTGAEQVYGQPISQDGLSSTVGSEAWNSRDLKSRPH